MDTIDIYRTAKLLEARAASIRAKHLERNPAN
jgi:hypothetical protein